MCVCGGGGWIPKKFIDLPPVPKFSFHLLFYTLGGRFFSKCFTKISMHCHHFCSFFFNILKANLLSTTCPVSIVDCRSTSAKNLTSNVLFSHYIRVTNLENLLEGTSKASLILFVKNPSLCILQVSLTSSEMGEVAFH